MSTASVPLGRGERARDSAMTDLNVYVAALPPTPDDDRVAERVRRVLIDLGVCGAEPDPETGWLPPGPQSWRAFRGAPGTGDAFDAAILEVGHVEQLLPNAHLGDFDANCSCGAPLSDALHALLEAQSDDGRLPARVVECAACGGATPLHGLGCSPPLLVSSAYVNFCGADGVELSDELVAALTEAFATPVRVLWERL